jgi:hypothetical protein
VELKVKQGIDFRPYPFILSVLRLSEDVKISLTIKDIGYYILNSADVLMGHAKPIEVVDSIKADRIKGIQRVVALNGKAYSYAHQHIREQLNYLELANLIFINKDGSLYLNHSEDRAIDIFIAELDKGSLFDTDYPLDTLNLTDEQKANVKYDPSDILVPRVDDRSRVYKGGSWNDRIYWLNPTARRYMQQDQSSSTVGFRCAMSILGKD